MTNCLSCGRIVCEQEGPGACMTCGTDLFSADQQARLAKQLAKRKHKAGADGSASDGAGATAAAVPTRAPDAAATEQELRLYKEATQKAEAFRNRLVEYDQTSARRTRVIGTHRLAHARALWRRTITSLG